MAVESSYNDSKLVSSGEAVRFWVDTLCCPVEDESRRAKAIQLMRDTYAGADRVLVLESYLQSQRTTSLNPTEMMMMIFCCKWQRRLWCLQERLLPGPEKLCFHFADCAMNLSHLFLASLPLPKITSGPLDGRPKIPGSVEAVLRSNFRMAISFAPDVYRNLYTVDKLETRPDASTAARLTALQSYLAFRTTSKASDEAVILATMLDVDVREILRAPRNDHMCRMELFWNALSSIPPHVIFWIGPKLQNPGFRWAPATFLTGRDLQYHQGLDTSRLARLTKDGLVVRYPGWALGPAGGYKIRAQFLMIDNTGKAYMVSCIDGQARQYLPPMQVLDLPVQFHQKGAMQLAVISENDLDEMR